LREQNVVRQEYFWRYGKTQRLRLHSQLSMRLGLTDPALGWNIGTPDTIARFSLERARAFWQQHYAPQAMTLVISGAFDRAAAEELTLSTLGAIPAASIPSTDKQSVAATVGGTTAVTLSVSDAQITDPAVQFLAYFDLNTLDDAARMRRLAATCALRPILAGGHRSVKGVSRTVLDTDTDARVVDIGLWLRDKRWLELGVYIEVSTSVARKRILGAVLSKLASLKADNTPAELLEDSRREGNGTWRMAVDAPDADAVVQWLSLGFSLEQRAGYRVALRALTADDVSRLISQVARPTVTARGEINPAKE
jgi:predicted Zn-dependent peptidase